MQLLFVHDHVFSVDSRGNVYSPGRLPYSSWQRYLDQFPNVRVLARAVSVPAADNLDLSSGAGVDFIFDHGYSGPRNLILSRPSVVRSIRAAIKRADAIVIRLPSELGLLAQSIARRCGIPCAVEVVGCAYDAYANYGSLGARLYAPIAMSRMKRGVRRASHAIYVTRTFLQSRYPNCGVTAFASNVQLPAVDDQVFERRIVRIRELGDSAVLGFMGSLKADYKGLDVAMLSLANMRRRGHEVQLRVLGDGDATRWRALAEEIGVASFVRFDGVLPAGDPVMRWLDEIDIFLQPSKQEGLPRSVIEAMSRAIPVLASTTGGIPELLDSECLHRPGDYDVLARHLHELLTDPAKMLRQAERNWCEAKAYEAAHVEAVRHAFWQNFSEYVRSGRK